MVNELLQLPSALDLLSQDTEKMGLFIDNLLAIIKKYLWFTELDTDNEGNPYDGEINYIYIYMYIYIYLANSKTDFHNYFL
jgi:hypothetical protein